MLTRCHREERSCPAVWGTAADAALMFVREAADWRGRGWAGTFGSVQSPHWYPWCWGWFESLVAQPSCIGPWQWVRFSLRTRSIAPLWTLTRTSHRPVYVSPKGFFILALSFLHWGLHIHGLWSDSPRSTDFIAPLTTAVGGFDCFCDGYLSSGAPGFRMKL